MYPEDSVYRHIEGGKELKGEHAVEEERKVADLPIDDDLRQFLCYLVCDLRKKAYQFLKEELKKVCMFTEKITEYCEKEEAVRDEGHHKEEGHGSGKHQAIVTKKIEKALPYYFR